MVPLTARSLRDFRWTLNRIFKDVDKGEIRKEEIGILSDLYFPVEAGGGSSEELAPLGLVVMTECQQRGIPCIIVTAGYHHGSKYNQVCFAGRLMGWPEMVDSDTPGEGEAQEKNWGSGLEKLEELATKNGAG
ncbi:MAG: hypothetical protein Q7R54_02645 [bacterium]|nr:hypothetical protein [bacterium]